MIPVTYDEWVKTQGKPGEWLYTAISLQSALRDSNKDFQLYADLLAQTIVKNLTEKGLNINQATISEGFNTRQVINYLLIDYTTFQGSYPAEYLQMAYSAWQEANREVERWKHKSLWSYLKYWFRRSKYEGTTS